MSATRPLHFETLQVHAGQERADPASGARAVPKAEAAAADQISLADVGADQVRKTLLSTDLNSLTPIEAMNLLFELQRKARS